jgi:hypothetical protein
MVCKPGITSLFILVLAFSALAAMRPRAAIADSLNLFIEEDYYNTSTKTVDASGGVNRLNNSEFAQKYYLTLDKTLFPTIRLNAGGIFEKLLSVNKINGVRTSSSELKPSLYCNLAFNSGIYNAGFSYNRRQDTQKSSTAARLSMVDENYNFVFGWKPDGLPSLDLRLGRNNNYDDKFQIQDTTTDTALLGLRYQPVKPLDLRYSGTYTDTNDKVHFTDTKELLQTARATYSDTFFNKRTSVFLDYKFTRRDTKTATGGAGEVTFQVFPISGLSLVETFPNIPTKDTLNPNPALIDGNTATSAGLDIGYSPSASGDTNYRDMGIQFADAVTECDTIYVWVDKTLPPAVYNSFSWEIYTSDDNLNWTLWSTVVPATFNTFQNRFEISFPRVKSRYIKVVTKPLALGVTTDTAYSDIFVTELQTFLAVPASEAVGRIATTSHVVNVSAKTTILSSPNLYHDVSLFLTDTTTGQTGITTYFLTNGLNFYKKFAGLVNVNARVAREDSDQTNGHQSAYVYSASATANPLSTLTDSFIYSGRRDYKPTGDSSTNSLTLFNKAELYKGINTYVSLGYNFGTLESGQKTYGSLVNFGMGFVPHKTLNLNVSYVYSSTRQTAAADKPSSSATSDRVEAAVTFTPVNALYLFASVSRTMTDTRAKVLTNYGLNFSPFPEGNLQLHFSYSENIGPADQGVNRLITPSLRWNIRGGTYLDLSYTMSKSRSSINSVDSRSFNASLKVTL